jgi:hypothetical protein
MMRSFARMLVLAALTALVAGCASTRIENAWENPAWQGGPLRNVMVFGISRDGVQRRIFEDTFVGQLRARGMAAVQSYLTLPGDGDPGREKVLQAVKAAGADGLITTRLMAVDRSLNVYPGTPYMVGRPWLGLGFYDFYGASWAYYSPPMVTTTTTLYMEVNVFAAQLGTLVWSGTTSTFEPTYNVQRFTLEFSQVVMDALEQGKVLALVPLKK